MDNRPIGVLDSGVGGLSIWTEVTAQLPHESTIFIADSKNCPYGNRPPEQIYRFVRRLVEFLLSKDVKLIVLACNTATVHCLARLREEFPNVPLVGTVPVVKKAAEESKKKKIGILSTKATAQSSYQRDLIKRFAKDCFVLNIGTDKLVPLVERGENDNPAVVPILKKELEPFIQNDIDTLALGCSHFPFLRRPMQEILGSRVSILDSGGAIARQVGRVLTSNDALSDEKSPVHLFYTTGDVTTFRNVVNKLLGKNFGTIERANI